MLLKSSPEAAAQMLEVGENDADKLYEVMIAAAENDVERELLLDIQREENAHSLMLQEMSNSRVMRHPQSRLERILGERKMACYCWRLDWSVSWLMPSTTVCA